MDNNVFNLSVKKTNSSLTRKDEYMFKFFLNYLNTSI